MSSLYPHSKPPSINPLAQRPFFEEIGRIICAAIVDLQYCDWLLADPKAALSAGYNGENFNFPPELEELIYTIQARNLAEFAAQLAFITGKSGFQSDRLPDEHRAYRLFDKKISPELIKHS